MERRRGTSLSSKLILTTTGLIAAIVVLFGFIDAWHMARIFDEQSERLSNVTKDALRRRGEVQTLDLVQASRNAALQNDYSTLQGFVPQISPPGDHDVGWVFVADKDGLVLAHSDRAKNGRPVEGGVERKLIEARGLEEKDDVDSPLGRLMVFARPIEHEGQRVGAVVIAFRLSPLAEQIAAISAEKKAATRQASRRTVLLGLMFVLFGSAVAVFQALRIARPLTLLAWRADQIARGDLSTRAEVDSTDEIGRLGESFNYMADQLTVLLRETAEKAVLERELEVARAIQESLVPPSDVVDRPGLSLAGYFAPASQVGGDWWTTHELPGDRVLVVIGDVTGHGTPAAMITACAKAACDTVRTLAGDRLSVPQLLAALNGAVYEAARRKFVMTCFASIIDLRARTITFANAGHNFPYLYRTRGGGDDLQILMSRGNPLGDSPESTWDARSQPIEPGDVLVWYTDGVVECESIRGEQYGEKRFRAAIRQAAALDARAMRDSVLRGAQEFYGAQPRKDDITMVFARLS
jgi:serine phosphatase RsbU (regulator of sigma subunit)